MSKKYQIFISSTYKDLIEVRRDVARSVLGLTEIPAAMEDFGAVDQAALDYIKAVIDKCDYYVLIVAGRYGAIDDSGISYTEQEYDYAVESKKTVIAFIRRDISTIPAIDVDADPIYADKLRKFREKVAAGRLVKYWDNGQDLQTSVVIALSNAFKNFPGIGWIRADSIDPAQNVAIRKLEFENQLLKQEIVDLKRINLNEDLENEGIYELYRINIRWISGGTENLSYVQLEWIEIFKIIAPLIRRYVRISAIREKFSSIILSVMQRNRNGMELAEISPETHEEIEFFFMGRELIENRDYEFLYLTKKGLGFLLGLRGSNSDPVYPSVS